MQTILTLFGMALVHGIGIGIGLSFAAEAIMAISGKGRAALLTYAKIEKAASK